MNETEDRCAIYRRPRKEIEAKIKELEEKIQAHSHGDKSDPYYLKCIYCRNMFVQIPALKWVLGK